MFLRSVIFLFLIVCYLGCSKPTEDEEVVYDYRFCGLVEGWASWSPDGKYITHARRWRHSDEILRFGSSSIWMYDIQTEKYGFLVGPGKFPRWNPQGTILAFNWGQAIYFFYPDARYVRQVTDPGEIYVFNWSADGSKLIFGGEYQGFSGCSIVDTLGNLVRNILNSSEGWRIGGTGVWSQENDRILVAAGDSLGNGALILVDTLGNFIREVLPFDGFEMHQWAPGWSPDESRIAINVTYIDDQGHTLGDLRIYDMEGQLERILTENAGMAQWSPDGSKIVFQKYTWMAPSHNPMLEPDCGRVTVWICNNDGSEARELLVWPQHDYDSTMFGGGYNWLNPPQPQ